MFLRPIFSVFAVSSVGLFKLLLLQYFAAKISAAHLSAFAMLYYLNIIFTVPGAAIGEASLISISSDPRRRVVKTIIGGGLGLYFGFVILVLPLLFYFLNPVAQFLDVGEINNLEKIFSLRILSGVIAGAINIGFYLYAILEMRRKTLFLYPLSFALTLLVNLFVFHLDVSEDVRFLYFNFGDVVCLSVVAIYLYLDQSAYFKLKLKDSLEFWRRVKVLLFGEVLALLSAWGAPAVYSKVLSVTYGGESVAAYNVATTIFEILALLLWSIQLSGVSWLTEIADFRGESEWRVALLSIRKASLVIVGIPFLILVFGAETLLQTVFGLASPQSTTIAAVVLISILPTLIVSDGVCLLKIIEKFHLKSFVDFGSVIVLGIPALIFIGPTSSVWFGMILGVVLPAVSSSLWLYYYAQRINLACQSKSR